jgi:nitroreductase
MEMVRMTLSALEVNELKQAPAVEGVLPAVHERWSSRSFADRAVSDADLLRIFEAARWTASAYNEQPWRFIVARQGSEAYKAIYESLIGFNQEWAGRAPVLILGAANAAFTHNGKPNAYALYDLGAATSQLTLQAAALGMTTHQMAGFDHDKAHRLLGIPEEYALGAVIALGYQGEPAALSNQALLEMETSPRERKPLGEILFSAWGAPANLK